MAAGTEMAALRAFASRVPFQVNTHGWRETVTRFAEKAAEAAQDDDIRTRVIQWLKDSGVQPDGFALLEPDPDGQSDLVLAIVEVEITSHLKDWKLGRYADLAWEVDLGAPQEVAAVRLYRVTGVGHDETLDLIRYRTNEMYSEQLAARADVAALQRGGKL